MCRVILPKASGTTDSELHKRMLWDEKFVTTSFGYISKVTLPDDSTYRYEYDKAGQLIKETDFTSRTLEYAYDPAGQLTYRTQADGHV